MATKCERCCEVPSEVECFDCGGGKTDKQGGIPLCIECSNLLHVGFMKSHNIETKEVKEKKAEFKEAIKNFKKREQVLKRSLVEIQHAQQNISSRFENNKYSVQQALRAISQELKKKEGELAACMQKTGSSLQQELAAGHKELEKQLQKLQNCHKKAEKLISADASKFMSEHAKISEEMEGLLKEQVVGGISSLNTPISMDALDVGRIVEELRSLASEWLASQSASEKASLREKLQDVKEGNKLQGYVESRLDDRGCFWLCPDMQEGTTDCLDDLSFDIRRDIITHGLEDLLVKEGSFCVAQYDQDHRWYRAKVEKLKDHTAEIRWLDYAHPGEVPLSHIQPLREKFLDIPFQGLVCTLFEDMSDDIPRQARWEFSDLTANVLLDCTIIKKLGMDRRRKMPIYLVKLELQGEEHLDVNKSVWEKAEESKSKKGPIAYQDVRLTHEDSKDIVVTKEVVNSSKKTSDEPKSGSNEEEKADGKTEDREKGEDSRDKEEEDEEEEEEKGGEEEEGGEEDGTTCEGQVGETSGCKNDTGNEEETANSGSNVDGDEAKAEIENGEGDDDDSFKDASEALDDLNLAKTLEKQADSAPAQPETVLEEMETSPMAFIAAHGSYTAVSGGSGADGSNALPPYGMPQTDPRMGWYQHYGSHFVVPNLGASGADEAHLVTANLSMNGHNYGVGSCHGVHVASPLTADGTFWAAKVRGHDQEVKFRRLMQEIGAPSDPLSMDQLHRGKLVCAFPPEMGHWCRGRVEEISKDMVYVRLSDFGSAVSLDSTQLKSMDISHTNMSFQALECTLAKENLTSFSESSRQLFHYLTVGKNATAKVDAASDVLVSVTLYVTGESGEVVDVFAELAKNEDAVKAEKAKQESAVPPQGNLSNSQPKPAPKAGFSSFLKEVYRKSPPFVADVERDFAALINDVNESKQSSQTFSFPPMSREQRAFIHELAESYLLSSDSHDQDAARHVTVMAIRGQSFVPSPTLTDVCQNEPRSGPPGLMDDPVNERDNRYMGGNVREDTKCCYHCGEMGHRKSNCPRMTRGRDRGKQPSWWGGDGGRKGRKGGGGGGGRRN
ncbi:uncharacterized protein [Diadema antillarum]|uniref:uncharacterized protein n=1 Tax=Diadema antillarum TaxID=105358 RepID=UPI003A88FEA4